MLKFIEGCYEFSHVLGYISIVDNKGFLYIIDNKNEWRWCHPSFGVPSKRGPYVEYEGEYYLMYEEPCFYA